jgi:integrase
MLTRKMISPAMLLLRFEGRSSHKQGRHLNVALPAIVVSVSASGIQEVAALRRAWATFHMQAGTPLHVVQEVGGWASPQMVQRYAHLTPGHLAGHVASFGDRVKLGVYDLATDKQVANA